MSPARIARLKRIALLSIAMLIAFDISAALGSTTTSEAPNAGDAESTALDTSQDPTPEVEQEASLAPVGDTGSGDIAEKATDPSAILMQMQFQYFHNVTEGADTDANRIILQPVLPIGKGNVLRATLPLLATSEPDRVEGMGDLAIVDFFLFPKGDSTVGIGPVASLPTATDDALGSGKWSLGPAFLWIYKGVPKTIFGVLAENLTSITGDSDRADVNVFLFQPIVTRHFKWGYLGWSGQQMVYDWENDSYSIPIGLTIGKVLIGKTPWNISVEPFYVFNRDRPNDYGLKFGWTAIFPSFHW